MSIGVKICGVRTPDVLEQVIAAGANYFGLVFFPPSPRTIDIAPARDLAERARCRILSVALTVNASDADLESIVETVAPDMLQLHGAETPERAAWIRERFDRPVIKAVSVGQEGDADRADAYRNAADLILFDAKPPAAGPDALPGGNGLPFDWRLLAPIRGKMPFMLSGGLTPDNVAEAVALTGATMVDVSSGVESAPGEKDPERIARFVQAATMPQELAGGSWPEMDTVQSRA